MATDAEALLQAKEILEKSLAEAKTASGARALKIAVEKAIAVIDAWQQQEESSKQ